MSEPKDHSQSPSSGAERFWGDYARQARGGARRADDGEPGPGNGHGIPHEQGGQAHQHDHECLEWCPICRTADVLRASAPPEIRDQWQSIQRDTLVTLRQLLDAYIDRLGAQPTRTGSRVEDIPIE
ncbi:MAG: hypothetical protein AABM29_11605 [Actinomycetota bacterium]